MLDPETFLSILYVMTDDFCKSHWPPETNPGPAASLNRSEVITLAVFSQWGHFRSERDFYRYAKNRLRPAFPTLPYRGQFNRLVRQHYTAVVVFLQHLVSLLQAQRCPYEALDSSAVPSRDAKRRGGGWLLGQADIGWSNHLGWYEGLRVLTSVNPQGVITGFSFAPASTKDQGLAEDFFAFRYEPHPRLPTLGRPAQGYYVVDKGFEGERWHLRWYLAMESRSSVRPRPIVSTPGPRDCGAGWPASGRLWRVSLTSSSTPSGWTGSGPMPWLAFRLAWRPR
jgi:hypothetical protein